MSTMMMAAEKVRTFSLGENSNSSSSSTSTGGSGLQQQQPHHHHHHHHTHHQHQHHHHDQHNRESSSSVAASDFGHEPPVPAALIADSIMNLSQVSTASNESAGARLQHPPAAAATLVGQQLCRFPKLEECAHFHYERVQLGAIVVRVVDEKLESQNSSVMQLNATTTIGQDVAASAVKMASPTAFHFILRVSARRSEPFLIKRSLDNLKMLDELLHRCVYDRKVSGLRDLQDVEAHFFKTSSSTCEDDVHELDVDYPQDEEEHDDNDDVVSRRARGSERNDWTAAATTTTPEESEEQLMKVVFNYFNQFSAIASDAMTCGPVLTWLQLDNKGRRLPVADLQTMTTINTPAVGAAYGVRKYVAQACDEISIEVGDMISVIDMPSPAESIWWRGKKSHLQKAHYEVGFFPQSCVATIGEKIPRHMPLPAPLVGSLALSPTKPVLRKHGKLIAFFRSFILSRPSRRRLKQSGIYKERVFSCDLSEHLLNSGQEIPMVLKCCAEFIERFGIVDGIYRLSGITSNIQRLRRAFDEERVPDLLQADIKQDIHAVSSLLKMYFRELPNPLCTYQLYDRFVEAIQVRTEEGGGEDERLKGMKETVQKLPPPHYRTLKYLANHLHTIAKHSPGTGMTDRNLAIVWAPNLLRSPALEAGGVAALRGVGVQAVVTEYLITNSELIFDEDFIQLTEYDSLQQESMTDAESLVMYEQHHLQQHQQHHHDSLTMIERPKSLNVAGGTKLISLEEAQSRHNRLENLDKAAAAAIPISSPQCTSFIEVGGGASSLPDKYHTVLPVPRHWQKRKPHSWKSLFSRGQRGSAPSTTNSNNSRPSAMTAKDIKVILKPSDNKSDKADKSGLLNDRSSNSKEAKGLRKDCIKLIDADNKSSAMTKSVDIFDGKATTTIEVCIRSCSVDSLRTAGHSRSVSHDSYFDLLQSPLRGIVNCPSRELSELGMNFDREEPEMRLFSESESLVSSPRVGGAGSSAGGGAGKDKPPMPNQCHTIATVNSRRVHRARPEEFSSTGNSVNPSPKKQPRLHLQATGNMMANAASATDHQQQQTWGPMSVDESVCKRYKLEDQLSDIQYIDCNTPEHLGLNAAYSSSSSLSAASFAQQAATKFNTNAQVHDPPTKNTSISSSEETIVEDNSTVRSPTNRFSYPQYVGMGQRRTDHNNDRFSCPGGASVRMVEGGCGMQKGSRGTGKFGGSGGSEDLKTRRYGYQEEEQQQQQELELEDKDSLVRSVLDHFNLKEVGTRTTTTSPAAAAAAAAASASALTLAASNHSIQTIVTPSSPSHSPRYSILTGGGDTSSENYSEHGGSMANLQTVDGGSLMDASITSATKLIEDRVVTVAATAASTSDKLLSFDDGGELPEPNNEGDVVQVLDLEKSFIDISALKRKFSLDLNAAKTRIAVEAEGCTTTAGLGCRINIPSTPNTPNHTPTSGGNTTTSQSMTPSEFGYQHLNRNSNICTPMTPTTDFLLGQEVTTTHMFNPAKVMHTGGGSGGTGGAGSPIKSTISITYNLRSPSESKSISESVDDYEVIEVDKGSMMMVMTTTRNEAEVVGKSESNTALLETSFDENMVYEQVKFFKSAVSELNHLVNEGHQAEEEQQQQQQRNQHMTAAQIVPEMPKTPPHSSTPSAEEGAASSSEDEKMDLQSDSSRPVDREARKQQLPKTTNNDDVTMAAIPSSEVDELPDSLEFDNNLSLYENVNVERPAAFYENVAPLEQQQQVKTTSNNKLSSSSNNSPVIETVAPVAAAAVVIDDKQQPVANFMVRKLATKFETSPIDPLPPPFDFSKSASNASFLRRSDPHRLESGPASLTTMHGQQQPRVASSSPIILPKPVIVPTNARSAITKSLDENAFVREFGSGSKLVERFTQNHNHRLGDHGHEQEENNNNNQNNENTNRRTTSLEMTKKSLNPPKKLPVLSAGGTEPNRTAEAAALCMGRDTSLSRIPKEVAAAVFMMNTPKIGTPTTENRISLVQHNNNNNNKNLSNTNNNNNNMIDKTTALDEELDRDVQKSGQSSLVSLGNCKLDRERIEKIKEERRLQLNEKFRSESFKGEKEYNRLKSQSKTELSTDPAHQLLHQHQLSNHHHHHHHQLDSLRLRSKSKADICCADLNSSGGVAAVLNHRPGRLRSEEHLLDGKLLLLEGSKPITASLVQQRIRTASESGGGARDDGSGTVVVGRESWRLKPVIKVAVAADKKTAAAAGSPTTATSSSNSSGVRESGRELESILKRNSQQTRDACSPQISIKDVAAMFESRSHI